MERGQPIDKDVLLARFSESCESYFLSNRAMMKRIRYSELKKRGYTLLSGVMPPVSRLELRVTKLEDLSDLQSRRLLFNQMCTARSLFEQLLCSISHNPEYQHKQLTLQEYNFCLTDALLHLLHNRMCALRKDYFRVIRAFSTCCIEPNCCRCSNPETIRKLLEANRTLSDFSDITLASLKDAFETESAKLNLPSCVFDISELKNVLEKRFLKPKTLDIDESKILIEHSDAKGNNGHSEIYDIIVEPTDEEVAQNKVYTYDEKAGVVSGLNAMTIFETHRSMFDSLNDAFLSRIGNVHTIT